MSIIIILTRRLPVHGRLDTSVCLSDRGAFVFKTRPEMELVAPFVGRPVFCGSLVEHSININWPGRAGAAEWPERGRRDATGSLVPIHRRSQFIRPIRL